MIQFIAMKIAACIVFVLFSLAQNSAKKPNGNDAQGQNKTDSAKEPQSPVTVNCNQTTGAIADHHKSEAPKLYASVEWANWFLVFVAAATGYAIWQQTVATRISAEAAEKSAAALVSSERAWLTTKVENIQPGGHLIQIAIPITNSGRTSAKVKKITVSRCVTPFPENGWGRPGPLPKVPVYDDTYTTTTEGKDFIIPPGGNHRAYVWIFPDEFTKMRERKISLYVYGVIDYLDTLKGEEHKTCFCELYWVPEKDFNEPEGFMFPANLIPEAYICAT